MILDRRLSMLPKRLALPAVLIAATGCALQTTAPPSSLAGACQMRACECANPGGPFGTFADIKPVVWLENGDASCPDGYSLRRVSR